jgi:hypothetical protein
MVVYTEFTWRLCDCECGWPQLTFFRFHGNGKVFMLHTVLLLNILELHYVITTKVFIYIVIVLMGRPHSCLVAHTPELFKNWHWNFHAWDHEMLYRLSVPCLVIVLFVFSSTMYSFLSLGISMPHNGCWFLLHVTLSLLLSCRDTSRITPQESHFLH